MTIDTSKREEHVLRYFNKIKPWMTIILSLIVLLTIIFNGYVLFNFKNVSVFHFAISIIISIVSVMVLIIIVISPRFNMRDYDYEELIRNDYDKIVNDYVMVHKDEMISNSVVSYSILRYPSCKGNAYIRSKRLKVWHGAHSKYNAMIFTEKSLIVYDIFINHITGNKAFVSCEEVYYDKISSVGFETKITKVDKEERDVLDISIKTSNQDVVKFNIRNMWITSKKMKLTYLLYIYLYNHLWKIIAINNLIMSIIFVILYLVLKVGLFWSITGMLSTLIVWIILMFVRVNKSINNEPSTIDEEENRIINKIMQVINKQKRSI